MGVVLSLWLAAFGCAHLNPTSFRAPGPAYATQALQGTHASGAQALPFRRGGAGRNFSSRNVFDCVAWRLLSSAAGLRGSAGCAGLGLEASDLAEQRQTGARVFGDDQRHHHRGAFDGAGARGQFDPARGIGQRLGADIGA